MVVQRRLGLFHTASLTETYEDEFSKGRSCSPQWGSEYLTKVEESAGWMVKVPVGDASRHAPSSSQMYVHGSPF